MNKSTLISFFLILSVSYGCRKVSEKNEETNPVEIIHLDNISAIKNKKQLLLSELVDSIEYIKLETNKNCLLPNSYKAFGTKYLVFASYEPAQVMLFNRQGKFIRKIGKEGKGPGEYIRPSRVDLSPEEDKILIVDSSIDAVIEYDIRGNHLKTYKPNAAITQRLYYSDKNTFVYIQSSPFNDSINFPELVALHLNSMEEVQLQPIDYIRQSGPIYEIFNSPKLSRNDNGLLYKNPRCDTLFQINSDLSVYPKAVVDVGQNTPPALMTADLNYDNVGYIFELPYHLLMIGNYKERFHQVFDKKTGVLFTLPKINDCRIKRTYPYGIINDIDGLKPFWAFTGMYIRDNSFMEMHHIIDLKEYFKTECFQNAELVIPHYRDKLSNLIEQSDINDNPIIRILHLKTD